MSSFSIFAFAFLFLRKVKTRDCFSLESTMICVFVKLLFVSFFDEDFENMFSILGI